MSDLTTEARLQTLLDAEEPSQAVSDHLVAIIDRELAAILDGEQPGSHDALSEATRLLCAAIGRIQRAEAAERYQARQRAREAGMRRALEAVTR